MDTKKIAKTALSYSSGYAGLKAGADTMRDAARIPLSGIQQVAKSYRRSEKRRDLIANWPGRWTEKRYGIRWLMITA